MNRIFVTLGVTLLTVSLSGCLSTPLVVRQTENQDIPTDSEAIVIIKFSPVSPIQSHPENYLMFRNRISTSKGIRERNISVSDSSVAYIRTKNRFAVMTMDITNNTYVKAIAELSEYDPTNYHTINITNSSCGGSLLATHITEPGIYYLGDVSYSKTVSDIGEEIFNYSVTSTIDEMKSHMRANYPNIPLDDINVKPIEEMFDYTTCGPGQQTIYIYL